MNESIALQHQTNLLVDRGCHLGLALVPTTNEATLNQCRVVLDLGYSIPSNVFETPMSPMKLPLYLTYVLPTLRRNPGAVSVPLVPRRLWPPASRTPMHPARPQQLMASHGRHGANDGESSMEVAMGKSVTNDWGFVWNCSNAMLDHRRLPLHI